MKHSLFLFALLLLGWGCDSVPEAVYVDGPKDKLRFNRLKQEKVNGLNGFSLAVNWRSEAIEGRQLWSVTGHLMDMSGNEVAVLGHPYLHEQPEEWFGLPEEVEGRQPGSSYKTFLPLAMFQLPQGEFSGTIRIEALRREVRWDSASLANPDPMEVVSVAEAPVKFTMPALSWYKMEMRGFRINTENYDPHDADWPSQREGTGSFPDPYWYISASGQDYYHEGRDGGYIMNRNSVQYDHVIRSDPFPVAEGDDFLLVTMEHDNIGNADPLGSIQLNPSVFSAQEEAPVVLEFGHIIDCRLRLFPVETPVDSLKVQ